MDLEILGSEFSVGKDLVRGLELLYGDQLALTLLRVHGFRV